MEPATRYWQLTAPPPELQLFKLSHVKELRQILKDFILCVCWRSFLSQNLKSEKCECNWEKMESFLCRQRDGGLLLTCWGRQFLWGNVDMLNMKWSSGWCQNGINMNARMQVLTAERCSATRWVLFPHVTCQREKRWDSMDEQCSSKKDSSVCSA